MRLLTVAFESDIWFICQDKDKPDCFCKTWLDEILSDGMGLLAFSNTDRNAISGFKSSFIRVRKVASCIHTGRFQSELLFKEFSVFS
jgi:hypothetical protein